MLFWILYVLYLQAEIHHHNHLAINYIYKLQMLFTIAEEK